MRSALRHLCEHGASALRPQRVVTKPVAVGEFTAKTSREVWRRPLLSKRVANTIRKQAIEEGTFGTFDVQTGKGWDPTWDLTLYSNRYNALRPAPFGKLQPSKKTSRQRSREQRAQKIETTLQTSRQTMEDYYSEKEQSRVQAQNFEARFKRMLGKGNGPGGGGGVGGGA